MSNTNIPSFNDICGTVTQALAETIINREALITQLREELAINRSLLHERCKNYNAVCEENKTLRAEIASNRTRRADFRCCNEQKSDTDPATGVQYGDLH